MNKHRRITPLVLLTVMLLSMMVFSSAALANGEPTPKPTATPQPTTVPTPIPLPTSVSEGTPFTNEGNMSLIDNLFTKATNKQFITVETKSGQLFYIVIDYDAVLNDETDSYEVHFLNMVDEADLLKLLEDGEIPAQTPEPTIKPTPNIEVIKDEGTSGGGLGGGTILLIIGVLAAAAAIYYFKVAKKKPKPKVPVNVDEYDLDDEDEDDADSHWEKEI